MCGVWMVDDEGNYTEHSFALDVSSNKLYDPLGQNIHSLYEI